MKIIKKSVLALLIAVMLCSGFVFSSCKKQNNDSGDDTKYETINIVKSGLSGYKIVIPANATECEKFSSEELRDFVKQSTGAVLSIATDNNVVYNPLDKVISIGETTIKTQAGVKMNDGLRKDAFALSSVKRMIFIYGNSDRANLYGVYEFLEQFVGVRFLTAEYTYVPEQQNVELQIPLNIVKNPAFDQRQYWSMDAQTNALYAARKRMVTYWNWSEPQYGYGMYRDFEASGHNVIRLLKSGAESFGLDSIPENAYATDIAGNRMSAVVNDEVVYDICWSDGINDDGTLVKEVKTAADGTKQPTAAQLLLEGLKNLLKENTTATIFCIMQEDTTSVVCDCPDCHAKKELYGAVSGNIVRMINAIAKEINIYNQGEQGDGRDIRIATYAYGYSQEAPVATKDGKYVVYDDTVIPNDHVIIEYCTMDGCNHTLAINDENQGAFHKDCLSKWEWLCEKNDNLAIYTYTANYGCALTYNPNLKTLKENIVCIYENLNRDMVTFENSIYTGDWQQSLRTYVASVLFWNPYAEVQPLIDEFITLTYGRSAKVVSAYVERMEALCDYNRSQFGSEFFLTVADNTDYMIHQSKFWQLGALETSVREIEAEMQAVANDGTLTTSEKERLTTELKRVLISPMLTMKFNYETYYGLAGDKDAFVEELKGLISEFPGMSQHANKYGLI